MKQQPPPLLPRRRKEHPPSALSPLTPVQATAVEALNGKISCVNRGYYDDSFISLLRPPVASSPPSMSPLINRGYYARVIALERFTRAFLQHAERLWAGWNRSREAQSHSEEETEDPVVANVLVLGAGLDSLYFRLADERRKEGRRTRTGLAGEEEGGPSEAPLPAFRWYEVDYPEVMQLKASLIARQEALSNLVGGPRRRVENEEVGSAVVGIMSESIDQGKGQEEEEEQEEVEGEGNGASLQHYAMVAADLGDIRQLEERLSVAGLDRGLPTLILAECVLVYLELEESTRLLQWASSTFHEAVVASYDMIRPHDSFGKVMVANLKGRGLMLPGFGKYPDLEAQMQRFVDEAGWDRALATNLHSVYQYLITSEERKRAQQLEMLDEVEEWTMLMHHYCYVLATKGLSMSSLFEDLPHFLHHQRKEQSEKRHPPLDGMADEGGTNGSTSEPSLPPPPPPSSTCEGSSSSEPPPCLHSSIRFPTIPETTEL